MISKKFLGGVLYIACIYGTYSLADFTQAIIPMAGLGTRLLPLTKAAPKSMVALIDKPALHHVVDEALQSNITDLCFIINAQERQAIEDYFSVDLVLNAILKERKKTYLLEPLNALLESTHFTYIAQAEPLGLGHAILMGEEFVQPGTFFCVMLPDNIIESDDPLMARLIALAQQYNASVITVEEISREQASQYAVVTPKEFLSDDVLEIVDIVEKPVSGDNYSLCLGQIGRHVFSYDIFESLKAIEPGVGGEFQLTDAVRHMLRNGKRVFAYKLHGKRHDIGNVRSLLKTTVILGLHNPLYRDMLCNIFNREMNHRNQ
jgi:UTP--glucose-1-phosphate uridylyltransferase